LQRSRARAEQLKRCDRARRWHDRDLLSL